MFLSWAIAFKFTWSLLSGKPEQNLSSNFNHMLLGVFVVVIEAQKLEVCIHKQNCTVEKLSETQFTVKVHEWWYWQYCHQNLCPGSDWKYTATFKAINSRIARYILNIEWKLKWNKLCERAEDQDLIKLILSRLWFQPWLFLHLLKLLTKFHCESSLAPD